MNQKTRLLVVDDNLYVSGPVAEYLGAAMGAECDLAADGAGAIKKIEFTAYDAVVTDCQMSGPMDGIDVVSVCLNNGIPVILMSGWRKNVLEKEVEERLGPENFRRVMSSFMRKPFSPSLLPDIIRTAMKSQVAA